MIRRALALLGCAAAAVGAAPPPVDESPHNAYRSFLFEIHRWLCRALEIEECRAGRVTRAQRDEYCASGNGSALAAERCAERRHGRASNESGAPPPEARPDDDGASGDPAGP